MSDVHQMIVEAQASILNTYPQLVLAEADLMNTIERTEQFREGFFSLRLLSALSATCTCLVDEAQKETEPARLLAVLIDVRVAMAAYVSTAAAQVHRLEGL